MQYLKVYIKHDTISTKVQVKPHEQVPIVTKIVSLGVTLHLSQ